MPNSANLEGFIDAIVDRVLARMDSAPIQGPLGEPSPEQLPDLPPGQRGVPPFLADPKLHSKGLEVTQSIQYYGTGYGPDNSVPIVALKPLVVRAYPYVTPGLLEGDTLSGKTVTGELVLFRWGKEVYRSGPTRATGARVGPVARLDRELWDRELTIPVKSSNLSVELEMIRFNPTVNFIVPAWYLRSGQTTVTVRLWLTSGEGGTVASSESFQVIPVEAPKLALVRVNWKNPITNVVTSPSDADLLGLTGLATRMLPFPYFKTTILGLEQTKSGDFSGPPNDENGVLVPGGCNKAWVDLLISLEVTRLFAALFQLADIVYGVVPQAAALTTMGYINNGCGWGNDGVGGCLVGDEIAFAHEVGHLYDCGHIGDPNLASYDANYPNYSGSKTSIGEVGIDTALGTTPLYDPGSYHDLMSYQKPQWISPYTYLKILDNRNKHMSAPADPRVVRPLLIFKFTVERFTNGTRIEKSIAHIVHGPGPIPSPGGKRSGNWFIELVNSNERIIASHACRIPTSLGGGCACGCGGTDIERAPRLDFVEAIEWSEEVTRITINQGDVQVASLEVGDAPSIEISGPERLVDSLVLNIRVQHPRQQPAVAVLFTADDGITWAPIAINAELNEPLVVDVRNLSGGESCFFRVVATAEFKSESADSHSFSLPRVDRQLLIDMKESNCDRGRVELKAMVNVRDYNGVSPLEVIWESNISGELGRGYMLTVDLEEGEHRITATIPGGANDKVQAAGIIIVGGNVK
jgi:hypothetical protein